MTFRFSWVLVSLICWLGVCPHCCAISSSKTSVEARKKFLSRNTPSKVIRSHKRCSSPLVRVSSVHQGIQIDLRYATTNNFTGKQIYPTNAKAYLRKATARKLAGVQEALGKEGLGLKVFDAYRPPSAQKKLWEIMPDRRYVANPKYGSIHSCGTAVDVTLIDLATGKELEMPSAFDDFSRKSHYSYVEASSEALKNREKLRTVMEKHGFQAIPTEWWHFNDSNWKSYGIIRKELRDLP